MREPILRDSKKIDIQELYPINEFPDEVIKKIGKQFVYLKLVGREDISGDDWGDIFAQAIGGEHLHSPLGLTDVKNNKMAWSMKTIKNKNPHTTKANIRLIIGRNSTDTSFKISDPRKNVQASGDAVLKIWNKRVDIAYGEYTSLRTAILIRSNDLLSYTLFEEDTRRYVPNAYEWRVNKNGNFEGYEIETGHHRFTWQPGGSQLTILTQIPKNAFKFKIKQPPKLDMNETLNQINYNDDWVEIL